MSLADFQNDPWAQASSHPAYKASFFHMTPAPEFATAEVLVSALYRSCGFEGASEQVVPALGKEFIRKYTNDRNHVKSGSPIDLETWRVVIESVLESPKQPNQSSRRFLQMTPLVPDVALYSGSARMTGSSWNPGPLLQRMVLLGTPNQAQAESTWRRLFEALSVTASDDIWARWVQEEFERRREDRWAWAHVSIEKHSELLPERTHHHLPAQQFVRDLLAIIDAKAQMTRRQWISMLEAMIRVGSVSHALWLCDVHARVWRALREVLGGAMPPASPPAIALETPLLTYGNPAVPVVRQLASKYLVARLGINAVLWHLQAAGCPEPKLTSLAGVHALLDSVSTMREKLGPARIVDDVALLQEGEKHARTIACKKGIGANLLEFSRYVLGQRQTQNEVLRGYDQGYVLRKKGNHSSAPWVVSLGPVAILAFVHCCLRESSGPRSVSRLCQHLEAYGIRVSSEDVTSGELGRSLRMLGLVLDSPDAESGMLLVHPFGNSHLTHK